MTREEAERIVALGAPRRDRVRSLRALDRSAAPDLPSRRTASSVRSRAGKKLLIAIGIAPGVQSFGYAVVVWDGSTTRPECLDWEIVRGSRKRPGDRHELARRCRAHHLILDPLLSRHDGAVVVLGPSVGGEPVESVMAVKLFFRAIAEALGLRVIELDKLEVCKSLNINGKHMTAEIKRKTGNVIGRDRRVVIATAAAMAGIAIVGRVGEA